MSSVQSIKQLADTYNTSATKKEEGNLDKNTFLQLLVTQMRYQDPLNPTNDKEFLAQMAQFSALEQMQNLNASYQTQQSFSLIGKTVVAKIVNPVSSQVQLIEGKVDGVNMYSGKAYLRIGDELVSIENIQEVSDSSVKEPEAKEPSTEETETDN